MSINIPTAYKTTVHIPFGKLKEHMVWCEKNLLGEWQCSENNAATPGFGVKNNWTFFFELERDCVAYTMWKKE